MRAQLDQALLVAEWRVTTRSATRPARSSDIPENAPDWWTGDEEASNSFLRAAGVVL